VKNRDLWFTLPSQKFLLVSWLFLAIPNSNYKLLVITKLSLCIDSSFSKHFVLNFSVQMYSNRSKFIQPAEKELWDKVPIEAMSSEEDALDDNEIVYHYSPSWRSDGITMLPFVYLLL